MDSKALKCHEFSVERPNAALNEINCEFWSRPQHFLTKTDP